MMPEADVTTICDKSRLAQSVQSVLWRGITEHHDFSGDNRTPWFLRGWQNTMISQGITEHHDFSARAKTINITIEGAHGEGLITWSTLRRPLGHTPRQAQFKMYSAEPACCGSLDQRRKGPTTFLGTLSPNSWRTLWRPKQNKCSHESTQLGYRDGR